MTVENLPEPPPRPAPRDVDSWREVILPIVQLAEKISETDFVPDALRGNPPAVAAAVLYGREIGFPPMTSLRSINVINGRPGLSAEAMRALILAAGHELKIDELTDTKATISGRRRGGSWTTVGFTISEAKRLRLDQGGRGANWRDRPQDMLAARATTRLARLIFADVISGFASWDELDDPEPGQDSPPEAPASPSGRTVRVQRAKPPAAAVEPPAGSVQSPPTGPAGPLQLVPPPLPGEDDEQASSGVVDESAPGASIHGDDAPGVGPVEAVGVGEDPKTSTGSEDAGPGDTHIKPERDEPPAAAERSGLSGSPPTGPASPMSNGQRRLIFVLLGQLRITDADEQRATLGTLIGHTVESRGSITSDEARIVIDTLSKIEDPVELDALLLASREMGGRVLPDGEA